MKLKILLQQLRMIANQLKSECNLNIYSPRLNFICILKELSSLEINMILNILKTLLYDLYNNPTFSEETKERYLRSIYVMTL